MNLQRIKKLQSRIRAPLLIKKKENLFYLTGQWFMHGFLLVRRNDLVFFGDGLEKVRGIKKFDRLKYLGKYLRRNSILQLEDEFTFAEYNYLKLRVKSEKLKVKFQHTKSPVDFQRTVKDLSEIALMKRSMQVVEKVFWQVKKQLKKKAWTERRLADYIEQIGLRLGVEDVSFPPIVASGGNAAIPHHVPGNKKLKAGESIIIDFGFKYQGYCSDFTRTMFLKRVPKKLGLVYQQTQKAYEKSIQAARPGLKAGDLYEMAVEVLAEKGLDKYFIHSLGHGTGLEIHELPNLSPLSKDVLRDGMIFSIEPGVYVPRLGGIRIEDLVYLSGVGLKRFIDVPTDLENNIIK